MRRILVALIGALTLLLIPALAQGKDPAVIEEYILEIPGPGGDRDARGGGPSGGESSLPPGTAAALESQGADGAAAAELAQRTGPEGGSGGERRGRGGGGDERAAGYSGIEDGGGSIVDDFLTTLVGDSDDGMGIALPIILAAVLVGALGLWLSRRGGEGPAGS